MNRNITNKEITVEGDIAIITENREERLNLRDLENMVRELQYRKDNIKRNNKDLMEEYQLVLNEEIELQKAIEKLKPIEENLEVIK